MLRVRMLWALVAVVLVYGYIADISPLQTRIHQLQVRANKLYGAANANNEVALRARELKAARRRIEADVARLGGRTNASAETARMLRLFALEGARYHVVIHAIAADDAIAPNVAASSSRTSGISLTSHPLTLTLRGTFRDIVPLLADLPRHDVLLEIRDTQLHALPSTGSAILLDATVAVALYDFQSSRPTEVSHAPSTP